MTDLRDPADMAEALAYERHRELDMPRRHRAELDAEIASERRAITNIESAIVFRTCAFCPAAATTSCSLCEEPVCEDDLIDDTCPDCLGLYHGAVPL